MRIRIGVPADRPRVEAFLADRGATRVARLGELVLTLDHPALVAERAGHLTGVLTFIIRGKVCEILTLHVLEQWRGTGSALIEEIERIARRRGCTRLVLITTNDNVDALRFYQRRGFRLAVLHRGAVDKSRSRLKPEIPELGAYGIPLRDEIELEKNL